MQGENNITCFYALTKSECFKNKFMITSFRFAVFMALYKSDANLFT